jgi:hypothetical protein
MILLLRIETISIKALFLFFSLTDVMQEKSTFSEGLTQKFLFTTRNINFHFTGL